MLNPSPGLDGGENLRNALTLVFVAGAAAVLLVATLRKPPAMGPSTDADDSGTGVPSDPA